MDSQDKPPINITFEIVPHPEPNLGWYDVTAVLSWKEEFEQRMDTELCWQDGMDQTKEAICFLIGERFAIQEVKDSIRNSV